MVPWVWRENPMAREQHMIPITCGACDKRVALRLKKVVGLGDGPVGGLRSIVGLLDRLRWDYAGPESTRIDPASWWALVASFGLEQKKIKKKSFVFLY